MVPIPIELVERILLFLKLGEILPVHPKLFCQTVGNRSIEEQLDVAIQWNLQYLFAKILQDSNNHCLVYNRLRIPRDSLIRNPTMLCLIFESRLMADPTLLFKIIQAQPWYITPRLLNIATNVQTPEMMNAIGVVHHHQQTRSIVKHNLTCLALIKPSLDDRFYRHHAINIMVWILGTLTFTALALVGIIILLIPAAVRAFR